MEEVPADTIGARAAAHMKFSTLPLAQFKLCRGGWWVLFLGQFILSPAPKNNSFLEAGDGAIRP